MARSNMFANMENKFEFSNADEITEKTLWAFAEVVNQLKEELNSKAMLALLVTGAKLGISSQNGKLNMLEKDLIDNTFGKVITTGIEEIYPLLSENINDHDYEIIGMCVQLGNNIALPMLDLILGFAYIDGEVDDKVLNKLDGMFGMNLLALFMESGLEEVPAPKIKLVGIEAEIVHWFEENEEQFSENGNLIQLNNIAENFPGKSKSEIKKALDDLCEKGVLNSIDTIVGYIYSLNCW